MLTTSATWKALAATGTARLETKALINGVEYLQMTAPKITRATMQGGLSIGNVVSATCSFSILTTDTIPRAAEVTLQMRYTDGTEYSEWLPVGTFYVSHREHDRVNNIISLDCFDSLLKANASLTGAPWTDNRGQNILTNKKEQIYFPVPYPCPMINMARDIAELIGVELDERSQIDTGPEYVIQRPIDGIQARDLLSTIAAANGGNWIITPENKLRLVPIVSATDAETAEDDVIDVVGVIGSIAATGIAEITGVRIQTSSGEVVIGDETGIVLNADLSSALAEALLEKVGGQVYQPFEMPSAIYDPAVELGDFVRHGSIISAVLYSETATYGAAFRGDIMAPEAQEIADEYPYIGTNAQAIKVLSGTVQALDENVQSIDEAVQDIDENVQELEEGKADVETVVTAQETAETAAVMAQEIQNTLGLWFTFDADRGLVVQKKDEDGNPISIWSTVTDEIGYHIQREDLEEYVFSAYRDRVQVQNLEIGNIIIKSSSTGGHIWTRK